MSYINSYSALRDDGDYTEICWCLYVLILLQKQFYGASVGNKTLMISRS